MKRITLIITVAAACIGQATLAESSGARHGMVTSKLLSYGSGILEDTPNSITDMAYICVENTDTVPYLTFLTRFSQEGDYMDDASITYSFLRQKLPGNGIFHNVGELLYDSSSIYHSFCLGLSFFRLLEPGERFYYIFTDVKSEQELDETVSHVAAMPFRPHDMHNFLRPVPLSREPVLYATRFWEQDTVPSTTSRVLDSCHGQSVHRQPTPTSISNQHSPHDINTETKDY